MTTEEAVLRLRADPAWAGLVRDSYLDEDVEQAALRFEASAEFGATRRLVQEHLAGGLAGRTVLDLGAGRGIATFAFARAGAARVVALEPDQSPVVGRQAILRCCRDLPGVSIVSGVGEALPLPSGSVDVVYARQVLHHARALDQLVAECARVLRPGGLFLAAREHVVDDEGQLEAFLRDHVIHQLAGGEHAWTLPDYERAIRAAGLRLVRRLGPWDTVVNAFPLVRTEEELRGHAKETLVRRLGPLGRLAARLPGVEAAVWRRIDQPVPGRLHTFVCVRPGAGKAPSP